MVAERQPDLQQLETPGRILPPQGRRHARLRQPGRRTRQRLQLTPGRLVRARRLSIPAGVARGLSLRPPRFGRRQHRHLGLRSHSSRFSDPRRLPAEEAQPDGRLEPQRVQPHSPAVRARLLAHGRAGQPGLPPIHREPWRARRAHVLRTNMKTAFKLLLASLAAALAWPAAALNVFTCEPEWASLAQELGGDKVAVFSATTAQQDPHRVEARPSLIARFRNADVLICSGSELEVGWLPLLFTQSGNARIQPGAPGYIEASQYVVRLEVPKVIDRALGDIHPQGNPHVHLDPRNIAKIAEVLTARFASPAHGTPAPIARAAEVSA